MFEFEEKEQYSLEEVKQLVENWKAQVNKELKTRDDAIANLTSKLENFEELSKFNHELQVKNLLLQNNLSDDVLDLVYDDDLEKVQAKIEKIKELTKEKEIENSYKPEKKRQDDAYNKALKNNDVESALKYKLSKLFQ